MYQNYFLVVIYKHDKVLRRCSDLIVETHSFHSVSRQSLDSIT